MFFGGFTLNGLNAKKFGLFMLGAGVILEL